jgi:hypothetical protein
LIEQVVNDLAGRRNASGRNARMSRLASAFGSSETAVSGLLTNSPGFHVFQFGGKGRPSGILGSLAKSPNMR